MYADDIVLNGNNSTLLKQFLVDLNAMFSFNDLGRMNYFLSIEVQHSSTSLLLHHHMYIVGLIERACVSYCKKLDTLMVSRGVLPKHEGNMWDEQTILGIGVLLALYDTAVSQDQKYWPSQLVDYINSFQYQLMFI